MWFKRLVAAFAFVAVSAAVTPAHAETDPRAALATEIIDLMGIEESLGAFFETMSPMIAQQMARDLRLGAVDGARLGELVAEEFAAALPGMAQEMAGVYATQMSEPQLIETLNFLRSPTGRAFVQTQFNSQAELERIGAMAGARVGLQAIDRFQQERARR
jgi:hypothetical protein